MLIENKWSNYNFVHFNIYTFREKNKDQSSEMNVASIARMLHAHLFICDTVTRPVYSLYSIIFYTPCKHQSAFKLLCGRHVHCMIY